MRSEAAEPQGLVVVMEQRDAPSAGAQRAHEPSEQSRDDGVQVGGGRHGLHPFLAALALARTGLVSTSHQAVHES